MTIESRSWLSTSWLATDSSRLLNKSLEKIVGIVFLNSFGLPEESKIIKEWLRYYCLGKRAPYDHSCSNDDTCQVLSKCQGNHSHHSATYLHNEQLKHKNTSNNNYEDPVSEEVAEGIELFSLEFTTVEEIKDGQENKNVKEKG